MTAVDPNTTRRCLVAVADADPEFGVTLPAKGEEVTLGWAEAGFLAARGVVVILPDDDDVDDFLARTNDSPCPAPKPPEG